MTGLRTFNLAFQVCKKIGPRLRVLPFSEFAWVSEVVHGVSHLVAVIPLNSVNSPEGVPIASANLDARAIHRHFVLRKT